MDDIGADELSKLSCNLNKTQQNRIFDSSTTSTTLSEPKEKNKFTRKMENNVTKREGDNSTGNATSSSVASNNVLGGEGSGMIDDDSDGKEKTDATPENIKKIDDVIMVNYGNDINTSQTGEELKIVEDESPSKQSLAFTIDFGEGETAASAAAAAKYKNMVERFQNRHKRGASLSKLEDQSMLTTPTVGRISRLSSAQSVKQNRIGTNGGGEAAKVKLRIRERSTSGVRDANKRHSWSPRSSTHEQIESQKVPDKPIKPEKVNTIIVKQCRPVLNREIIETEVTTTANPLPVIQPQVQPRKIRQASKPEQISEDINRSTMFKPRSTAMQIALNKVEYVCPEPLLDDFIQRKNEGDCESVSEAGTYTVDGDNYTEEQKELMNIDKSNLASKEALKDPCQVRPTNLPLASSTSENRRRNNVLEISYYHDSTSLKPKISYLEKIKSRVKNITKSPDKKLKSSSDLGIFTSVTTSGVLSKKPTLDPHPKLNRKNSLTKSQIDSSEYISTDSSLKSMGPNFPNTFTDHQKAEYKLSVFTNQTDSQILAEGVINYDLDTPVTPESPVENYTKPIISETGLKTAQTKSDWIQEWAKNARARSSSSSSTKPNGQMSRSYDFETISDSVFVDPVVYRNKPIDRFRNHAIGDFEYSSDTNVSGRKIVGSNQSLSGEYNGNNNVTARPPLSPSRIPSPMHTIGRRRSASRTRSSLQDLSPSAMCTPETDVYLQKTAVAISNLAQSFSRKNSLYSSKSPTSNNNSPRRLYRQQQHFSADEFSPTHEPNSNGLHPGLHKRNLSLDYRNNVMSHSLNNETLTGMLDHRNRQRPRQNSFDAAMGSPRRFYQQQKVDYIEQTLSSIKQQQQQQQQLQQHQQSPLRRSSSFSVKTLSTKQPQFNRNFPKCTPVAKVITPPKNVAPIQKSASSTSFRKMYSDYDDNIEYYINDEDDLVDEYLSSDDYDEPVEYYPEPEPEPEPPEPLTNTRYNKALLMRIERSKQRVAGNTSSTGGQNKIPISGGVIACPNTPEMPRRAAQNVTRSSMRQSVPRDSSLNRLRGEVPNSLASAKKQLLQTASNTKKVQPKYMDISKYKPVQGASFLRKDDSKSTLVSRPEMRRSPSSASVTISRGDTARTSNRSVKSAGGRPNTTAVGVGGGISSMKRDTSVPKQKEAELAMWKRRATYDPMKAAAEGRKKQEDAKKMAQTQQQQNQPKSNESSSIVVMRSQSFHSGVGTISNDGHIQRPTSGNNPLNNGNECNYRWTLTSTESSDEDEEFIVNNS